MTTTPPREQLPPKPTPSWARDHHGETEVYTWPETQAYAREALRVQAASVPVGEVLHDEMFGCKAGQLFEDLPIGTKLYAGAPPSPAHIPADVEAVRWPAAWEQARQQACRAVEGHRGLKTDAILESTIAAGVRAAFEDLWYVLQKSYADVSPPQAPQAVGRAQIAIYERLLPLIATCLKHQQVNSASELMRQLDGEIAALATKGQQS